MLTLFTVPKAFRGEFAVIQRNAAESWSRLQPGCEILMLGDEDGIYESAATICAIHLPQLERNEYGTPLLSSVVREAEEAASYSHLCYINADIILLSDFLPAIQRILDWNPRSVIVGRRWDMKIVQPLDFTSGWEDDLRARVAREGKLHSATGLDYFVVPRGFWNELPPFAIGRGLWDQWLLSRARTRGVPVVDATACVTVVHQNHGYSHHPDGEVGVWKGVEMQRNYALGGGLRNAYTLRDATHRLIPQGVRRRVLPFDLERCLIFPIISHKWARPLVRLKKALIPEWGGESP